MKYKLFSLFFLSTLLLRAPVQGQEPLDLLTYIPSNAVAAAAADENSYQQLQEFLKAAPEMRNDLALFFTQNLGVDLTQINGMAAWSTSMGAQPVGALFLRVPGGAQSAKSVAAPIKKKKKDKKSKSNDSVATVDGIKLVEVGSLVAAAVPGGVLLGNEAGVRAGAALSNKKNRKNSLAANGELASFLKPKNKGDFVLAATSRLVDDADTRQILQAYGIQQLLLTTNQKHLRIEAIGDPQRLEQARSMLEGLVAVSLQKLRMERDRVLAKDAKVGISDGVGKILAFHQMSKAWEELRPKLQGNRLVSEYELPDFSKFSGAWAAWTSMLAGIAIPTYFDYVQRARASGARVTMKNFWTLVHAWAFNQDLSSPNFSFPKSTPWTPAKICCGSQTCASNAKEWQHPTWKALHFEQTIPQRYQYRFTSAGKGNKATFTIEARGDLDCDGVYSSFKRTGRIVNGDIRGGELTVTKEKE